MSDTPEKKPARKPRAKQKPSVRGTRWEQGFLDAVEREGVLQDACRISRVNRSTVFHKRKSSPAFDAAFRAAKLKGMESLEEEMHYRAKHGSDVLLMYALRYGWSEKYGDKSRVEVVGQVEHSHKHFVLGRVLRDPEAFAAAKKLRDRFGQLMESNVEPEGSEEGEAAAEQGLLGTEGQGPNGHANGNGFKGHANGSSGTNGNSQQE